MELKQIWTSANTEIGSHYAAKVLGGSLGLAVLAAALVAGCTTLLYRLGLMNEWVTLVLCLAVTALIVVAAFRLRRSVQRDRTIFYLTEDDRLFVLDAASQYRHTGGVLGMAEGAIKTEQFLNENACRPVLPAGADEILAVDNLKENAGHYAIRCRVRCPNGATADKTWLLVKGIPDQELLLRQLERRLRGARSLEPARSRNPLGIGISTAALVCCVALCVLSHPAVGLLAATLYFPGLGAAFAAFCCLTWFLVRQQRGE